MVFLFIQYAIDKVSLARTETNSNILNGEDLFNNTIYFQPNAIIARTYKVNLLHIVLV